jgi:Uncharacterized protein conserved in bacteria
MEILKVSSKSNPSSVAGAIANLIVGDNEVAIHAVGAGAINQAIKAIAVAQRFVEQNEIMLVCIPSFIELEIDGEQRTAIKLVIEKK